MTKQQENRAFVKMLKEFPKVFGRVSFRERLMLRVAFAYVVEKIITDLENENAELKEHHKSVCETLTNTHRSIREQLTKAKDLLKEFVQHYKNKTIYVENMQDLLEQSEQFLKEETK